MSNTNTATVGNPLSVRRAEILEAIQNKTYAPVAVSWNIATVVNHLLKVNFSHQHQSS